MHLSQEMKWRRNHGFGMTSWIIIKTETETQLVWDLLYNPSWPGPSSPASAFQVLGLQECDIQNISKQIRPQSPKKRLQSFWVSQDPFLAAMIQSLITMRPGEFWGRTLGSHGRGMATLKPPCYIEGEILTNQCGNVSVLLTSVDTCRDARCISALSQSWAWSSWGRRKWDGVVNAFPLKHFTPLLLGLWWIPIHLSDCNNQVYLQG